MNFILVQYDPFVMESRLFVMKDQHIMQSKVASDLNTLSQELVNCAQLYGVYNVKLNAPNGVFEAVQEDVTTIEATKYGTNKIILEKV